LKATNAIISSMADIPIMGSSMSAGFVFASDAAGGVTAALNQMIGPLLAANMFLGQGKLAAYAQAAGMYALRAAHLAYAGGAYIAAAASRVLAAAMASTGIGALVVGLGLLVGWLLLTEDKMKNLSKAWEWVKSIGKTALKFMISPLAIFGEGISGHLLKMVNQNAYLQRIWETLQYVWDVLVNTWESIKKGVTSIYDEIGKPLHKLGEMLDKAFSWLFDKMGRIWDKFFETEEETAVESEEENAPIAEGTWGGPQFPTVQSAEELAKFYRINENAIYNNSLNGSSMLGSELAENMLINPLARVKMAAEYGLPRFGEEEAKPEAAVADVVPALEAFTEEQRKDAEAFIDAGHVLRHDSTGLVLRSVKQIENEIIAVKKGKEGKNWEDWVDNPNTPDLDAKMPGIWSSRGGVWDLLWSLTALSTTRNPNEDEIYHPPNAAETGLNPPKEPEKPVSPEQPETFDGGTYTIVRTGIDKYGNQIYGVDLQSVGRVADGFTSEEEANNWAKDDQAKRFVSAETGGTVGEGGLLDVHAKERIVNAQITSRADSALETLVKMLTGGGVEAGDANRGARQVSHTHNWYFPQSVSTIGGNINWSQMQYFIEQTMHRAERQYHGD